MRVRVLQPGPAALSGYSKCRGERACRAVASHRLVPGDVVVLLPGKATCDMVLLRGNCLVEESLLSGEVLSVLLLVCARSQTQLATSATRIWALRLLPDARQAVSVCADCSCFCASCASRIMLSVLCWAVLLVWCSLCPWMARKTWCPDLQLVQCYSQHQKHCWYASWQ